MTVDLATLGIKIDASEVTPAATKLDQLTAAGVKAEAATGKLTVSSKDFAAALKANGNDMAKAVASIEGQNASVGALTNTYKLLPPVAREFGGEVEKAAGHVQGSSIKIRESLVLMREASRGAYTRMAGSASILAGAFGLLTAANVGLLLTIGVLAAPFIAVAVAMERGSEEAAKLNNSLAITGGYSGLTASSYENMARRISAANQTSIRTSEAGISQLINSGKFSAEAIGYAVDAAERFSRFTGESVEKILQGYEGMKGGVAKWGAKHEEIYHDLTFAQLLYIEQLEKQGKHEAAETQLMADIDAHVKTLAVNYGYLEGSLHKVEVAASNMWAAMMNWGKPETSIDKIKKDYDDIAQAQHDIANPQAGLFVSKENVQANAQARLRPLYAKLQADMAASKAESDAAAEAAAKARSEDDKIQKHFGPKGPKAANDNTLTNASGELTALKNRVTAQVALNTALASGAISVDALNKQDKINADLAPILKKQAEDFAKGTAQGAKDANGLTPIIAKLRVAYGALYDSELETRIRKQNDAMGDQNTILEKQISLAGQSAEQRAVQLAQFKKTVELGDSAKTPAGQAAIGLAGKNASLGFSNSRAALGNENIDAGTSLGTSAARATLASNPKNYIQQQAAAYAEIDKLRKADVLSETQAAQAKAQVDVDISAQRLSTAQSFFSSLSSLSSSKNKELAAIGKASAIASATIDGVLAVQKALASYPPPVNFVMAGAVGVAAAVNVAKIQGLANGGPVVGPGGPTSDSVPLWGSNGEFMMNARANSPQNRPLLEAMNKGYSPANGNSKSGGGITVEYHNYGTPHVAEVQQLDENRIRIIAREEDHKNAPGIMGAEAARKNSPLRRALTQHTNVTGKSAA